MTVGLATTEVAMITTRQRTNPVNQPARPRAIARVAAPPTDNQLALVRRLVLVAGFLVLLAALLTHIGG
jgi:hypothetical protein